MRVFARRHRKSSRTIVSAVLTPVRAAAVLLVVLFEVPAVFFLCTFVIVQLPGGLAVIADLAAGLAAGAALCLVLRKPMVW